MPPALVPELRLDSKRRDDNLLSIKMSEEKLSRVPTVCKGEENPCFDDEAELQHQILCQ